MQALIPSLMHSFIHSRVDHVGICCNLGQYTPFLQQIEGYKKRNKEGVKIPKQQQGRSEEKREDEVRVGGEREEGRKIARQKLNVFITLGKSCGKTRLPLKSISEKGASEKRNKDDAVWERESEWGSTAIDIYSLCSLLGERRTAASSFGLI